MNCTRCQGTGFINLSQIEDEELFDDGGCEAVLKWISDNEDHDVQVCDCCGNGEEWYEDEPGTHKQKNYGNNGPYAYNGGLPECN